MTSVRPKWWSSIRVRLTALYSGIFFLAGLMLIAVIVFEAAQIFPRHVVVRADLPSEHATVTSFVDGDEQSAEPPIEIVETVAGIEEQMLRGRRAAIGRLLVISVAVLSVMTAIGGVLGWVLAGQTLQPLRLMAATARRVADQNLHERIALDGPADEIRDLADTLDSMFERLDQAFDSQQRFIANASHELRTPLAINRTLIEVALMDSPEANEKLRQLGATLLAVNHRHERLIDGLLTLTGSEQRIVNPAPVDLAEIAEHVVAEAAKSAKDAAPEFRRQLKPALTAGEPVLLERLAENLIENAIRYNAPEGGWVRIATDTVGDHVELVVENPGPLIPHYDAPRLFEPFQRLSRDERRADPTGGSMARGAGLGLSIVRAVAQAHGGDAVATPREEGGLTVRVKLPTFSFAQDDAPTRENA